MSAALLAHGDGPVHGTPGTYVGSALYDVLPEHVPALWAMVLTAGLALLVHRWPHLFPGGGRVSRLLALPVERVVAVWAMLASAAAHAALVLTHGASAWGLVFGVDAVALAWAADRVVRGRRRAGPAAVVVLAGSLLGLVADPLTHQVPDQVALVCKLVEIAGLLALAAPAAAGRWRRPLGVAAVTALTLPAVVGAWVAGLTGPVPIAAAMTASDHDEDSATAAERRAADDLWRATAAAVAKYADPAVAVADGYAARGIRGEDFHADNDRYVHDDHVLDPARPETLVYAVRADGTPVLLGAMFQMQGLRRHGPTPGGPLTAWHAHEQVCFGLLPPSVDGATSPLGVCPAGTVTVALTNEMMHVWTVPGAPARFGDLPDGWVRANVVRAATWPPVATPAASPSGAPAAAGGPLRAPVR